MGGAALNFSQLALVFLIDLPDDGGHGLACAAVLPGKEDAKGRGDDQADQADHHNGKDGNPASSGDSGHQRLNGRKQSLCRNGSALCGGFCGSSGGLCCDAGGLGGRSRGSGCGLRCLCCMVRCLDGGFRRAWSSLGGMLGGFYRSLGALDGVLRARACVLCGLPHSLGGLFCRFYGEFRLPGRLCGVWGLDPRWPVRWNSPISNLPFPLGLLLSKGPTSLHIRACGIRWTLYAGLGGWMLRHVLMMRKALAFWGRPSVSLRSVSIRGYTLGRSRGVGLFSGGRILLALFCRPLLPLALKQLPALSHRRFRAGRGHICRIVGKVIGGKLCLIRGILIGRGLPVIHQGLRVLFRTDEGAFHALAYNSGLVQYLNVFTLFTGFNFAFAHGVTPIRLFIQRCFRSAGAT